MRLRIQLPAKAGSFRISNCEAKKVLTMPDEVFQAFLERPVAKENMVTKYDYRQEESGRIYCGVLVLSEGQEDGVFVYDRGRHFAYLPGARSIVDSILEEAVEKIVQEGTENTNDGNWCYYFSELYEQMALIVEEGNGLDAMLLQKLERRPEVAEATLTDECFDLCCCPDYCKNLTQKKGQLPSTAPDRRSVLYQVVERGHAAAFVCGGGGKITDLCDLLARASAIAGERGGSFADALEQTAAKSGIPLRPVLADEVEALSHDLGHGGAADQRMVIDLDEHRIRVEYDYRADSFQECLETLKERFPSVVSEKLQNKSNLAVGPRSDEAAIHLRDVVAMGLPDHDVYLVHQAEDVGWVPAADLPQLSERGKGKFTELLDAKVTAIRPGPYGTELVLDGVDPKLLIQYDETIADYYRAESALELFM